jgi:hypothetical protein
MAQEFAMLPEEAQRTRLLQALEVLIKKVGYERFVSGFIFEPDPKHFPDRVAGTQHGLRQLLHRLLTYAGLGQLDVLLEVYDSNDPYTSSDEEGSERGYEPPQSAAAWFAGIGDGQALFGVDVQQLRDAGVLVGVLCHEVAHAFREHHGLCVSDRDTEERLTDLTTVYLGFGILTTNASYTYRATSRREGNWVSSELSEGRMGYLEPNEMAFLLAAQCVLRELPGDELGQLERKAVERSLSTTQLEMFRAAVRSLGQQPHDLRTELGIPDPADWPVPAVLPEVRPLEPLDDEDTARPLRSVGVERDRNRGEQVFRVRDNRRWFGLFIGSVLGLVLWLPFAKHTSGTGYLVPVGALLGYLWGRATRTYTCSDPNCGTQLSVTGTACPKCGGAIRGTIAKAKDRLAVEEALAEGQDTPLLLSLEAGETGEERKST